MPSSRTSSPSTSDLGPGDVVAGFRIERAIGTGPSGAVYEATQLGLNRRVALKLLTRPGQRVPDWPEHPHVLSLYAAGISQHGPYLAMQLVRGTTLAELRGRARVAAVLEQVAAAVDAGVGLGAIEAHNVLVAHDGNAFVDPGLGAARPPDRAAFAALVADSLGVDPPTGSSATEMLSSAAARRRGRRWWPAGLAAGSGAAAIVVAVVLLSGAGKRPQGPPAVLAHALVLGSPLSAARVASLDCDGRPPTGASQECTVIQTRLPGRALVAARTGAIRRWVVLGARGGLALHVLRRRGGQYVSIARTAYELVPDRGVHALTANLPIRAGDRIGVQVAPGAAIGVGRDVRGATTARSFGPLTFAERPVQRGPGTGFDHELLLRVEYVPGARATVPGSLSGAAARRAPAGRRLGDRDIEPRRGTVRTVAVVAVGRRVAVDLFDGARRLQRVPVPDAQTAGRLLAFDSIGEPTVHLSWRNPDGRVVAHDYAVSASALVLSG